MLAQPAAMGVVALGGVDHLALLHHVLEAVGQPGGGGQPVPTGPAGLLVVALDRLGQVQVGHEAHVGLVDAHAEGDRGHHDQAVLAQEPRLVLGAGPRVQPGVIGQRRNSLRGEPFRGLVHRGPRQAVDDAGVAVVLGAQQVQQLPLRLVLRHDAVLDVGPVEAGDEMPRLLQVEPAGDLLAGGLGGGSGQRDPRHLRPPLVQMGQLKVVRPEVVAPLGDAVRLVDGEQRDPAAGEQLRRGLHA